MTNSCWLTWSKLFLVATFQLDQLNHFGYFWIKQVIMYYKRQCLPTEKWVHPDKCDYKLEPSSCKRHTYIAMFIVYCSSASVPHTSWRRNMAMSVSYREQALVKLWKKVWLFGSLWQLCWSEKQKSESQKTTSITSKTIYNFFMLRYGSTKQ